MSKQFVWALVATLGLVGCGGGGSSDGGSDDDGGSRNQITADDLIGTWVESRVNYADPMMTGSYEWVKTLRQTVIVERVSGVFRFRSCVSGDVSAATLSNDSISLAALPGVTLDVVDANTLTTTVVLANSETEITLQKVSNSTQYVLANVDLSVDLGSQQVDRDQWNQVCVETVVDKYVANTVALKAVGSENGITGTVAVKFETPDYFTETQYDYPSSGNNVTGSYAVTLLGSGTLSNPDGYMIMAANSTIDMYFNVTMDNSSSDDSVVIDGEINIAPAWFEGEPE